MKQVLIRRGAVEVAEVPAPVPGPGEILVRLAHSCISAGTEMAGVKASGEPLHRRALKHPEHVRLALKMLREEGLSRTVGAIRGALDAGQPTGYSAAGTVVAAGDLVEGFVPGDLVACAGAGIANHAEYIRVPVNLAVKIPPGLSTRLASTVTLGAIALQGVRRASPTLGETMVVIGLGLLGQLTAQLLAASGCRVIGADLDERRVALATSLGMAHAAPAGPGEFLSRVTMLTSGFGADAVIIAAAAPGDEIVSLAMQCCRKKGRVVLVGDVGLGLKRGDFYVKELDFLISTSYGPGRYDPVYEQGGADYPIAYVRWTENRNMEEFLRLLAEGKVSVEPLIGGTHPLDQAAAAYASLGGEGEKPLIALLEYPQAGGEPSRSVVLPPKPGVKGAIRVGLAGAGAFAQGMILPNLVKLRGDFAVTAVMSRSGTTAKAAATRFGAGIATTDYQVLLEDKDIDLVVVATRHDSHAAMALQALEAGKHVFVEKPLCLTETELEAILDFYRTNPGGPLLMAGYNRRFSPAAVALRQALANRATPVMAEYRMNAGYLPPGHWVHGPEGGGRNLGEACHIYDLFVSLCGPGIDAITALSISPGAANLRRDDNFTATMRFGDGSVCTLLYTALGSRDHPKERMHLFADSKVYFLDDYKALSVDGGGGVWTAARADKGHLAEFAALARAIKDGGPWPIPLGELAASVKIAFAVERQIAAAG